jgi:hypothetical protein
MQIPFRLLVVFILLNVISTSCLATQKKLDLSPRILSAKTAYFENQTGSDVAGNGALAQLKKWGKFQIVPDRQHADLVILLSADPYGGGKIIMSGGQTGSVDTRGHVEEDPIPQYGKLSQNRYACLTVIDPTTGDKLWSAEHVWGGLMTGFNSVGDRLIKELEKLEKKDSHLLDAPAAGHSNNISQAESWFQTIFS